MDSWAQIVLTIVGSVLASSGFWAYMMKRADRNDVKTEMLIGLGHDRIVYLGLLYIERGYITQDEYENLYEYLYIPYKKLGGNGSAERVMNEVQKLPIHKARYEGT
jgi:hypothetical protein